MSKEKVEWKIIDASIGATDSLLADMEKFSSDLARSENERRKKAAALNIDPEKIQAIKDVANARYIQEGREIDRPDDPGGRAIPVYWHHSHRQHKPSTRSFHPAPKKPDRHSGWRG